MFVDMCVYVVGCFFPPMYPFPKAELSRASFVLVTDTVVPASLPSHGLYAGPGGAKKPLVSSSPLHPRQLCLGSGRLLPAQAQGLRLQVIGSSPLLSSPGLSYKICYICIG